MKVSPVILCGGSGTRLWPLSRVGFPKQFLAFSGAESLFQQAVLRINAIAADDIDLNETLIVTNEDHRFLVSNQIQELKSVSATLLLEPVGRNTAAALTLAALQATATGEDPILVVTPADQTVTDAVAFGGVLQKAVRVAAAGVIVTLGITPNRPEVGYGYIKASSILDAENEIDVVFDVDQFIEKPDLLTAERYLTEGGYYWNGGIFVLKASVWLKALQRFRPDVAEITNQAWMGRKNDLPFVRPDQAIFATIPSISIDYAVMEPITRPMSTDADEILSLKMIPLDAGWNDLGAWDAVWQVGEHDANGNVTVGDSLLIDTENTLVHASSRLVSAVGVSDLVIVETPDAVMVADRSQSQNVKKIVAVLEKQHREEHTWHRKVHRPWGWYDVIDQEERFKVKRIQVNPKPA